MKKHLSLTLLFNLCFSVIIFSQTVFHDYHDGQLFIKYKNGSFKIKKGQNPQDINVADVPALGEYVAKYGIIKITKPFYQADDDINIRHIYKIYFSNKDAVQNFIADLRSQNTVDYAEKVPIDNLHITPNDPSYGSQWHLAKIGAPNAWNYFNGNSNITVAIVDNAIDINHNDLTGNKWVNPGEIPSNGIDDDGNGYIDDINGYDVADKDNNVLPPNGNFSHGTHCAGIAAGRTDNNLGIASIGWNLKIMSVKSTSNSASFSSITNGYEGIIYAAKSKARVISCSWGGTGSAASLQLIINYAWNKGSIICVSAGNDNNNVLHYPAAYNNVYSVASSDNTDTKSGFSCFGTWVDITAPGSSILSTYPSNTYNTISGTSMACPLVAGLAGLILAKNPYLTQTDVLNCISSTAVNIYTVSGNSSYSGQLGAGRIDADKAMQCSNTSLGWNPKANFVTMTPTVCPSKAVQFLDKTLYNPTSWSWTFQSGSPATSTLANPSVTWSAPGVYGVTLTATNGNGSNTAVKAGYITITNPISLPLQEGFQAAAFPPSGWTNYDFGLDSAMWERVTGVGGFTVGASQACTRFNNWDYDTEPDRDELITPKYDMTLVTTARLRFDVAYAIIHPTAYPTYFDTLQVRISTNCGTSWTSIYLKGGPTLTTAPSMSTGIFVPTSSQWRRDSIDITGIAAGQGNVMFSFVDRGHYGQPIYLDNINIVYVAPPQANWSTTGLMCSGQTFTLSDMSVGTPTAWVWTMPGASPATSTVQSPVVSYSVAGVYNVTLTATNSFGNSTSIKTITVTSTPTIGVSSSKMACFGQCDGIISTTLTGGTGPFSYNVNGAACPSAPTCSNLCAFNYTYNVTDSKGCTSKVVKAITSPTAGPITSTLTPVAASCGTCANGGINTNVSGSYPGYTYSWTPGSSTSANLSNVAPGCYTVVITDSQGCTKTSSDCVGFANSITSQSNLNSNAIYVMPNPNNGLFVIKSDMQDVFDVTIYNSLGQLIKQYPDNKSELKVNLETYGKGIYNIVFSVNGNSKNLKVVVE